jgi:hypothetical protein
MRRQGGLKNENHKKQCNTNTCHKQASRTRAIRRDLNAPRSQWLKFMHCFSSLGLVKFCSTHLAKSDGRTSRGSQMGVAASILQRRRQAGEGDPPSSELVGITAGSKGGPRTLEQLAAALSGPSSSFRRPRPQGAAEGRTSSHGVRRRPGGSDGSLPARCLGPHDPACGTA